MSAFRVLMVLDGYKQLRTVRSKEGRRGVTIKVLTRYPEGCTITTIKKLPRRK